MKIIHTVPSLSLSAGGPSRSVTQLCNHLASVEEVSLVTTVTSDDLCVNASKSVNVINTPVRNAARLLPAELLRFRTALMKELTSCTRCLVHQHGIWLSTSHESTYFAVKNNVPLILSTRGMLEPWSLRRSRWKKNLAWFSYQKRDLSAVTAFHATACMEAESIRSLGFKQPIAIIPNGVNTTEANSPTIDFQKTHRSDTTKRTALFLSRLNPKKGLPLLVEAWGQMRPLGWQLLIAGNDDSNTRPDLERRIAALGIGQSVKIVGPAYGEHKANLFRAADLFILPSYSENFGIVVAEALSYGVPVLTTTGCPWQELIEKDCGWWEEPTLDGICKGLSKAFATQGERLKEMGANGLSLVKNKYHWPAITNSMLDFYNWILSGKSYPSFIV